MAKSRHPVKGDSNRRSRATFVRSAVAIAAALCFGIILYAVWLPKSPSPSGSSGGVTESAPREQSDEAVYAAYAGSASCRECHETAYAEWVKSHHGLAERNLNSGDHGAFREQTLPGGSMIRMTEGRSEVVTDGTNGQGAFAVSRVIGEMPLRQFLVPFPGGRLQTLELSYDPRSNEWFNVYGSEERRSGEWGHWTGRGMNWNSMCAACHNTRLRKNYEESSDAYSTAMAEMSVGCESCHGPLKAHNEWQRQFGKSGRPDPTLLKLDRRQTVENCAFCHARRGDLTGDFKPGDRFGDHMQLAMVDRSDTFYADGQVRDEDYEYAAFLGSRMHAAGVACGDCHNPHSAKTVLPGNFLCMRCHDGTMTNAPVIHPVTHSRHKVFGYDSSGTLTNFDLSSYLGPVKETGGQCVNCHMPQTVYMQRHWRHDHGFTSPDPLLTREAGIPNACNRCHQDKDVEWALKYCEEWYGDRMERPSRRRTRLIEAARRNEPGAHNGLLEILGKEEIPYWRAVAAGLLDASIQEPSVREALMKGLSDTNELVRAECVRVLAPIANEANPSILSALQRRLEDPLRNVRVAAAWALASRVDPLSAAGRDLLRMLDLNADQPVGQMQKGAFAFSRGDAATAAAHYAKAVQWDPYAAGIRHDFAVVLSQLNRTTEAVEQLEQACRLDARNGDFRYKLALAYHEAGQGEKVIPTLQEAVKLEPGLAGAWYNLGLALSGSGRMAEAIDALQRAESAAPEARAAYARATILARLGRVDEARAAAQRALEIQGDFEPALELLRLLQADR